MKKKGTHQRKKSLAQSALFISPELSYDMCNKTTPNIDSKRRNSNDDFLSIGMACLTLRIFRNIH